MDDLLTRLPFMAAFLIALAAMPCDVYAFNQRGIGHARIEPWRQTRAGERARARESLLSRTWRAVRHVLGNERGAVNTDLLVPVPSSIGARLKGLKQEKANLVQESTAILDAGAKDGRNLSKEELATDEKIHARIATINEEIKRYERLIETDRVTVSQVSQQDGPAVGPIRSFGEFLQAVACAASPIVCGRLSNGRELVDRLAAYSAAAGMSVGTPADGGYLVRKDWTTQLLDKARESAVLYPRCREIPIGGDFDGLEYPYIDESSRVDGSRWGGVQVFWKAEAATVTAKQPKIGRGELRLEEIMGLAYATERLLRDSTALEGLLGDAFSSEFAFKVDDSIVRGNGAGQMLGFLNSPALVTQAAEGGQAVDTVNVDNVLKMYSRMPGRLKAGAVWLIHSDVMTQLPKMVIGQQPVWLPPGGVQNSPLSTLLGKPVIEIEQASAIGDVGDICFVNLREYVVIAKTGEGVRQDTSMHVRFLTDEMTFRWVYRVNGQPVARTALTPFKGSSTQSAFVTLAAR